MSETPEDLLVTTGKYFQLMRPIEGLDSMVLFLIVDREQSNLVMTRRRLQEVAERMFSAKNYQHSEWDDYLVAE